MVAAEVAQEDEDDHHDQANGEAAVRTRTSATEARMVMVRSVST